jgi:hypothetical protein
MSQVTVPLDEDLDRVVGIVKSLYGVSSKSKAIQLIISEKGNEMMEREFKPSFVKEMKRLGKTAKFKKFYSSVGEMRRDLERA